MKRIVFLAVVAVLATPVSAGSMVLGASGAQVSILFGSVTPAQIDVVAGDSVQWMNDSVRDHTVTADDGSYDSGSLGPNQHFSHMFESDGTYAYHCRLHPYIRGQIDVHTLLLDRPAQPAAPGRPYPLSGRAALASGAPVAIEFDGGSGWQKVADASVGADGSFNTQVAPATSGSYRAVSGDAHSPAVDLLVLDRTVTMSTRRTRRGSLATVSVTPASPGATVVLQLYLKDRFGWWPVAKKRLDKRSRATFTLPKPRRRVSARVVLALPDGATIVSVSPVVRLHH